MLLALARLLIPHQIDRKGEPDETLPADLLGRQHADASKLSWIQWPEDSENHPFPGNYGA
jgi:hypothetical protein